VPGCNPVDVPSLDVGFGAVIVLDV
jgi:hypothetical protein